MFITDHVLQSNYHHIEQRCMDLVGRKMILSLIANSCVLTSIDHSLMFAFEDIKCPSVTPIN